MWCRLLLGGTEGVIAMHVKNFEWWGIWVYLLNWTWMPILEKKNPCSCSTFIFKISDDTDANYNGLYKQIMGLVYYSLYYIST